MCRLSGGLPQVGLLSGGELQRFAIATCVVQKSDVYMFDEPSSYLDVKQRLTAAAVIRSVVVGEECMKKSERPTTLPFFFLYLIFDGPRFTF